jgi:predicted Zn finger-like uncharacterized protein
MSLLTRCPACETLYRLVPDQLRISQGWVKCGQCSEIFDASQHLVELALAEEQEPKKDETEPEEPTSPLTGDALEDNESCLDGPVQAEGEPADTSDWVDTRDTEIVADAPDQVTTEAIPEDVSAPLETFPPASQDLATTVPMATEPGVGASFLQDKVDRREPYASWLRAGLYVVMAGLVVGLGGQYVYWEREKLAAAYPSLKPVLQRICAPIGCSVKALQRIDALTLDAAAFQKISEDTYRLTFVIKNQSVLMLALPSVELTLTDVQDQPVIRRVLTPAELFDSSVELGDGSDRAVIRLIQIKQSELLQRVVGYRLLAFYP